MYFKISKIVNVRKFKLRVIQRLKRQLELCGVNFKDFCNLLIENNACLSGSFLLQVIQNKYYHDVNSDIDIYTMGHKNEILEKSINDLLKNALQNTLNNNINKISASANELVEEKNKSLFHAHNENENFDDFGYRKFNSENYQVAGELSPDNTILNNYKGINSCSIARLAFLESKEYKDVNINEIVNFVTRTIKKYQLIYCNRQNYKNFKDIINKFDFDFCANYFDGKRLYIKNFNSIKKSFCVLRLKSHRIYGNQSRRITKYIERGFTIRIKQASDIFNVIHVKMSKDNIVIFSNNVSNLPSNNINNLVIICENQEINIDSFINNLPAHLEKLIIYTYPHNTVMNNLPPALNELRLYIWKAHTGIENIDANTIKNIPVEAKKYNKKQQLHITQTKKNLGKIPFDCNIYINDELINS